MGLEKAVVTYPVLGGMRTDIPLTSFPPEAAVIVRNVRMTTSGRITRRQGGVKYNTTPLPAGSNILGIYQFLFTGGDIFLECQDTSIYIDTGITQTVIKTGQTPGNYYDFTTYEGYCLIVNGVDTPLKYDGTNLYSLSIAPPSTNGTATQTTGGSLTLLGTYSYWVVYENSVMPQYSQPYATPTTITLTGTNNAVTLYSLPISVDPQVDKKLIYRTTASGSQWLAQLVATIPNAQTTYLDTMSDATLLNNELINFSYDPAPTFQKLVISNNRAFGFKANDSTLYYSMPNAPWYWPQGLVDTELTALNYTIPVGEGDGDIITNVIEYYNYLIVFKNRSIYVLTGYDTNSFQLTRLEFMQGVGCVGPRAALTAMNWCYFIDYNGIYRTNGTVIEYVGKPMQGFFDPQSTSTEDKVYAPSLPTSVVTLDNRKPLYCIRFSLPSTLSTYNDLGLIYDYNDNQWFYDNGYRAQSYCIRAENGLQYLMRGDDLGFVYIENSQDGDGGLITSMATSGTPTTLTDTLLSMTPNFYEGCYIEILSGTSQGDKFRILSNTATQFTIDGTWTTTPDTSSYYTVGGIDYFYMHRWDNYGEAAKTKRWYFLRPRYDSDGAYTLIVYYLYDFQAPSSVTGSYITPLQGITTWDSIYAWAFWDTGIWDSPSITQYLQRPPANMIHNWSSYAFAHKEAGQQVRLSSYDKIYAIKGFGIRYLP